MADTNQALVALMDLVLAMVDVLDAPTATQARKARDKVLAERREVEGWRETLYLMGTEANRRRLEAATRLAVAAGVVDAGEAARTAVAATERRLRAWQGLEPIEADDSRITDGHKCCGGKPDCGCARSVGG